MAEKREFYGELLRQSHKRYCEVIEWYNEEQRKYVAAHYRLVAANRRRKRAELALKKCRLALRKESDNRLGFEVQAAMDALAFFPGEQVTIVNLATLPAIHNTWADYLIRDLMLLKDCDAIVMLPNWMQSKGAMTEHAFAEGMGIEIHYLRKEPEMVLT